MATRRRSASRPFAQDRVREIRYSILYGPQEPERRVSSRLAWSQKAPRVHAGREPPRGPRATARPQDRVRRGDQPGVESRRTPNRVRRSSAYSKPVSRRPVRSQKGAERATAPRARRLARSGRKGSGQHHRRNPKSRTGGSPRRRWS
jgi:hypothetical protein